MQYIAHALHERITTKHVLNTQFGRSYYIEFQLTNPYMIDQTFDIRFNHSNLRIVKNLDEWKYLKKTHHVRGGTMESDMIHCKEHAGEGQIWLRGGESIPIPFVYSQFECMSDSHVVQVSQVTKCHFSAHFSSRCRF